MLHRGRIYTPAGPRITAMLVDGPTVAWLGDENAVGAHLDAADAVVDLDGALVTPAFVDAHVHLTATGLARTGLDLSTSRSAIDILDAVAVHGARSDAAVVLGSGWDESGWAHAALPSADELQRAGGGLTVYLARVDAHSALVSADLAGATAGRAGYSADGWLRGDAHDTARRAALGRLGETDRRRAQREAVAHAASLGIGSVHEMAGPSISSLADLADLLGPDEERAPLEIVGYWGELGGAAAAVEVGAAGAAGDLFCDGAIGSHTAAVHEPYTDRPDLHPPVRYSAEEMGHHIADCTRSGIQAGFHAIGDAAVDAVLDAMDRAGAQCGDAAVRGAGHRLEHVEMVRAVDRFAAAGLIASMQPAFDAAWGGGDGLYQRRLGPVRAAAMNDFGALLSAGVALAFGSDSPVTAFAPWEGVRAAAHPHRPESAISVRAAYAAHTRGGWRAARRDGDGSGVLAVGHPATYAVWSGGELRVDAPDERIARWSTDPHATLAGLPDLSSGSPAPRCLGTVVRGRAAYDAGDRRPVTGDR